MLRERRKVCDVAVRAQTREPRARSLVFGWPAALLVPQVTVTRFPGRSRLADSFLLCGRPLIFSVS